MTDRELLELAAKAAGVEVFWSDVHETFFLIEKYDYGSEFQKDAEWKPLTDDGDALRLAVKLKLTVGFEFDRVIVVSSDDKIATEYLYDKPQTDIYAATRRAITRAAAEIGKSL